LAILARQFSALEASFSLLPDDEENEALAPMASVLGELSSGWPIMIPIFRPCLLLSWPGAHPSRSALPIIILIKNKCQNGGCGGRGKNYFSLKNA
jgi:hypothetical protein